MAFSGDKTVFAQKCQQLAQSISGEGDLLAAIAKAWFDRGYNTVGANPLVDGDVTGLKLTAADVTSFITFAQQFGNFLGNVAVSTGDYKSTLNKIRTDI